MMLIQPPIFLNLPKQRTNIYSSFKTESDSTSPRPFLTKNIFLQGLPCDLENISDPKELKLSSRWALKESWFSPLVLRPSQTISFLNFTHKATSFSRIKITEFYSASGLINIVKLLKLPSERSILLNMQRIFIFRIFRSTLQLWKL